MLQRSFMISDEGDQFIRDQLRKKQDFFFFNSFIILGIVAVTGYLKLDVIDRGAILFGLCLFLVMMASNLRQYVKFKKLKAQLIRSVQIDGERIILTTYREDKYEPVLYELPLKNTVFTKGILKSKSSTEKPLGTELFGIPETYTLSADSNPRNTFYLMSSFWPEWYQMRELCTQERAAVSVA